MICFEMNWFLWIMLPLGALMLIWLGYVIRMGKESKDLLRALGVVK